MRADVARLFDAMAGSYDELEPWYRHLYAVLHAMLRAARRPPAGGGRRRALDAGCGSGFQTALVWALASALAGDVLGDGLTPAEACRLLVRRPGASVVVDYPGSGPLRRFTAGELRAMAREAGLVVRRIRGIHMLTDLIPSTVLHRPRPPRPLGALFAGLAAADAGLRRLPGTFRVASSLVVLAVKPARPASPGG